MSLDEEIAVSIKDSSELYSAYMPFVTNGGLFIPTNKSYKMGQLISLKIKLIDEIIDTLILSKIVWITPPRTDNHKMCGIGVQFMKEDNGDTKIKIESLLASNKTTRKPTYTM